MNQLSVCASCLSFFETGGTFIINHEVNMKTSNKLYYSYIRWSSDAQTDGSTLARQRSLALEYVEKQGYSANEIEEILDEGVSAFSSKNSKKGKLSEFIDDIRSGRKSNDGVLLLENLDRLSRDNIFNADDLFKELLSYGLTIVTTMDGKEYSKAKILENPMDLLQSILLFSRAHDESKTKSIRTKSSAVKVIEAHKQGIRADDGYALAVNSVGNNMWWADCGNIGSKACRQYSVKPHPIYFPIAKEMIAMAKQGDSIRTVAEYLNNKAKTDELYQAPSTSTDGAWTHSRISKFYTSPALYGEKILNINGQKYVLDNYYPKLMSEDEFNRFQAIRQVKYSKSKIENKRISLLTGMGILRCGFCGGTMYTTGKSNGKRRYICRTGHYSKKDDINKKCTQWSFQAEWAEDTVLRLAANHVFMPEDLSEDFRVKEQVLLNQLEDIKKQSKSLSNAIKSGLDLEEIIEDFESIKLKRAEIEREVANIQYRQRIQLTESVIWKNVDENVLDPYQNDLRTKVKEKIALTISKMVCIQVKERHIAFSITFTNGHTLIAHRTPQTLAFDGNAWLELGNHFGSKVLLSESEKMQSKALAMADDKPINNDLSFLGELSKYVIDINSEQLTNCIGESDGYKYTGLFNIPLPIANDFVNGHIHKPLAQDILRVKHLINFGKNKSSTPIIIEDQYQVFKHRVKKNIVFKPKADIYYVNDVRFIDSVHQPAWITKH